MNGHPEGLSVLEVSHFGEAEPGGGLPRGLLDWLYAKMGVADPDSVVHFCSGSMRRGITVDIRPETGAKIVADCRKTGIPSGTVGAVVSDPPPTSVYNSAVYGLIDTDYPQPNEIMKEAERILAPGGKLALLSYYKPSLDYGLVLRGTYAIELGSSYVIRGIYLYEKRHGD